MKKILVTGGSGYIGSVVVHRLLEQNYQVLVFDNLERGHKCNVPVDNDNCTLVVGDLRNPDAIRTAMLDFRPDAVMHFAAYALVGESMSDPMMYFENNVSGGAHLLSAMASTGCKRLIFSSSCATYGVPASLPIEEDFPQSPTNPYGQSKLIFEQMANWQMKANGLRPTFLRYFNAAGAVEELGEDHEPETHIIPNVLKVALGQAKAVRIYGNDYPTPDGTCIRDYVHIDDLANAHILALEKDTAGAFNLGTGEGVSVRKIVEVCCKVTGHDIPVVWCPRRPGDPPALYASGTKARQTLGWTPDKSSIDNIIRDAWNFHRSHPSGLREQT